MPDYMPDSELNELIHELNRSASERSERRDAEPEEGERATLGAREVATDDPLRALLVEMSRLGATDLLLIPGAQPVYRVNGRLVRGEAPVVGHDDVPQLFGSLMPDLSARMRSEASIDFSIHLATGEAVAVTRGRFRVNVHRQRGDLAAAVRALPSTVPSLEALNLPRSLAALVEPTRGLVLISGPTGSGKSTTLAAMLSEVNHNRAAHVITIEDPVEYEHQNDRSIFEHVEIGRDAPTWSVALRGALRQNPDIILVGEMRDLDTVATALTAAESGHLILATLHTGDAAQAIHRIVDVFPAGQQAQVRQQLAISLNAIVCQQLVPRSDGTGRVPAVEVLIANDAVRNHIRHGRVENLLSEITLGKRAGMIALEESLATLVREGVISRRDAEVRSRRPDELRSLLG